MTDRTRLQNLILGVDLDGVCADFYARIREIAAEWFERSIQDLPTNVSFGLPEWGVKTKDEYESLHRFAVTQRGLFKTSRMIPGARKNLRQLSDEGVRIRIITHRLFIHYFTIWQFLRQSTGLTRMEFRSITPTKTIHNDNR